MFLKTFFLTTFCGTTAQESNVIFMNSVSNACEAQWKAWGPEILLVGVVLSRERNNRPIQTRTSIISYYEYPKSQMKAFFHYYFHPPQQKIDQMTLVGAEDLYPQFSELLSCDFPGGTFVVGVFSTIFIAAGCGELQFRHWHHSN